VSERYEINDVACTVCGCVCDDLQITIERNRIVAAEGSCPLSHNWLLEHHSAERAVAEVNGQPAPLADAARRAAEILLAANWPLISGCLRSSTQGSRAAVHLADQLGACIDMTASPGHAASILAIQQNGISTCTLGEVRHRADLVIFWGADPLESHPRHWERYSVEPAGRFVPGGRRDRMVIVIDDQRTRSAEQADQFILLDPDEQFELLWYLRARVRGIADPERPIAGVPEDVIGELADQMKSCRYGVVFFGDRLTQTKLGHRNVEALLRLVTELNDHTRFHAREMGSQSTMGAENILCWQTGYPMAVSLHRGYPRYGPGEYSATEMLRRGEVDACLVVGSQMVSQLEGPAREHLQRMPTIALDHPTDKSPIRPAVRFTTAVDGVHRAGTAYRMDDVPIRLRRLLTSHYPSQAEVLEQIARTVAGKPT